MSAVSVNGDNGATNANGKCAADEFREAVSTGGTVIDGKSAVDDEDWFSRAARRLYPHKAGTALHLITDLGDERLCQRYAAGHVKPPAYFLRALLRGEQGEAWLRMLMDGCDAPWWKEFREAADFGRKVRSLK